MTRFNRVSCTAEVGGFTLGSTNPEPICVAQETLGFRWRWFSHLFLLLMPTFLLLCLPPALTRRLHKREDTPLPIRPRSDPVQSVLGLAPNIFGASHPARTSLPLGTALLLTKVRN